MSEWIEKELPSSWAWASLDDLGVWSGGGTPSKSNSAFWAKGTIPWVSSKDMKSFEIFDTEDHITEEAIRKSATTKLPTGTVLVVTRSGILRHTLPVAVSRVTVTCNQDLKALKPHDGFYATYVAYAIRAASQIILHSCVKDGTTVQSVEFADLKRFRIPIAPINEQQRIADALDELLSDLDAGVAALQSAKAKLELYRASVLKAAVQGDLTAEWREQHPNAEPASALLQRILTERRQRWEQDQLRRFKAAGKTPPANWKAKYKEPVAPDTTNLPPLPKGWCWASVDELCYEVRNGYSRKPEAAQGVRIFRISAVRPLALDSDDVRFLSGIEKDYIEFLVKGGDILFTRYNGTKSLVAVCAVVPDGIRATVHPDKLIRARLASLLVDPKFVALAGNVGSTRHFLEARIRTTAGQAGVSGTDIKQAPIPLPPSPEQQVIAETIDDQLSVLEHVESELKNKKTSSEAMRQSILRHAFTGQLVPQDPSDEPANELLKHIASERAAQSTKKKAPRKRAAKRQRREK